MGTTYYWQVKAINNYGTSYANSSETAYWSFKTANAPTAFNKLTPANGVTGSATSRTLIWSASTGQSSYEYCLDTTNDNACTTGWISTGSNRSVSVSSLATGTTYYWQVRAINKYGATYANDSETAYWSFRTVSPPGVFNKLTPANDTTGSSTTRTLIWSTSSGVTSYEYCIDTTNDNTCTTTWINTGGSRSVTVSGLDPATTYYWQVKAINSHGTTYANGAETIYWMFTTSRLIAPYS
jgi:hypothetical protein